MKLTFMKLTICYINTFYLFISQNVYFKTTYILILFVFSLINCIILYFI